VFTSPVVQEAQIGSRLIAPAGWIQPVTPCSRAQAATASGIDEVGDRHAHRQRGLAGAMRGYDHASA
jgi:hypothetical protein